MAKLICWHSVDLMGTVDCQSEVEARLSSTGNKGNLYLMRLSPTFLTSLHNICILYTYHIQTRALECERAVLAGLPVSLKIPLLIVPAILNVLSKVFCSK